MRVASPQTSFGAHLSGLLPATHRMVSDLDGEAVRLNRRIHGGLIGLEESVPPDVLDVA